MITPDEIVKSNRKTLSLCVMKDGKVIIRAPLKIKNDDINKFVIQKQAWLSEKISVIENNKNKYGDVITYNKLLFLGQKYTMSYDKSKKITIGDNNQILLPMGVEKAKLSKLIKSWYIKQAKEIIKNRSNEISNKIKLFPTLIKFSNSKGRWGSCSSKSIISYNWRLIMLPPDVIDYVIIHELCHMIEFNHSKKFWELVQAFMPNAKARRVKIKEFSFLLDMF